jgi:cobalt transporter subunit CbtB
MQKFGQISMREAAAGRSVAGARAGALLPVLAAALLGAFIVWGVGFAGASVLHNAAHDARHAHAFPCH